MQTILMLLFFALLALKLLSLVVGVWFVVLGFRVHWGWGLANLLIPGAIIPFCILHPKESKRPMILAVACLAIFLILWVCVKLGSHSRPRVEVTPGLPASATHAVLYLNLAAFNDVPPTNLVRILGQTISDSISLRNPGVQGTLSIEGDEERLVAIRAGGFVIQFKTRSGGETQTNFILFPFGQTTETNLLGWSIVGSFKPLNEAAMPAPINNTNINFQLKTLP
jgi:hypothetical protein